MSETNAYSYYESSNLGGIYTDFRVYQIITLIILSQLAKACGQYSGTVAILRYLGLSPLPASSVQWLGN